MVIELNEFVLIPRPFDVEVMEWMVGQKRYKWLYEDVSVNRPNNYIVKQGLTIAKILSNGIQNAVDKALDKTKKWWKFW